MIIKDGAVAQERIEKRLAGVIVDEIVEKVIGVIVVRMMTIVLALTWQYIISPCFPSPL